MTPTMFTAMGLQSVHTNKIPKVITIPRDPEINIIRRNCSFSVTSLIAKISKIYCISPVQVVIKRVKISPHEPKKKLISNGVTLLF